MLHECELCRKKVYKTFYSISIDKIVCKECSRSSEKEFRKTNPEKYFSRTGIFKNDVREYLKYKASIDSLLATIKKKAKNEGKSNIFISGCTGSGKSLLCVSIILNSIEKMRLTDMKYINMPLILDKLKQNNDFNCYSFLLNSLNNYKMLLIDDLGAEKITDSRLEFQYLLIDSRIGKNLITIVTSNLSLEEISINLSNRISSRLSSFCQIKMTEKDYRCV